MKNTRLRCLIVTFLSITLFMVGCASGPPPGPDPAVLAGQNAKVILVAPFNIVSALPPDLEGSSRMISDALVDHLEAHGKTVHRIGFRAGRDLWAASMKEVRSSGKKRNFENAAKIYAQKIGEQIKFDAMIVASLFIQNAKVRSRVARWDGAQQLMKFNKDEGAKRNLFRGTQYGTINARAASIFVHILDRAGTSIHTKRSGIEVIEQLEMKSKHTGGPSGRTEPVLSFEPKFPPIQDKELVRAGVAASLSPFLPEEVPVAVEGESESQTSVESLETGDAK